MSWKEITAGDKQGFAKVMRVIKSPEKGTTGIEITFEFIEPATGAKEFCRWTKWYTGGSKKQIDEVLQLLDCNGNLDKRDSAGVCTDPNIINFKKEVSLKIVMEERVRKETGEAYSAPAIAFVNPIGGSGYEGVEVGAVDSSIDEMKAAILQRKLSPKNHAPQSTNTQNSGFKPPF